MYAMYIYILAVALYMYKYIPTTTSYAPRDDATPSVHIGTRRLYYLGWI